MTATTSTPANSTIVRFDALPLLLLRAYFGIASRVTPRLARRHAERLFTLPPRYAGSRPPPVPARRETVAAGSHQVAVWHAGPAEAPAVLLAHGWGGRGVQMGRFVAPLLAHGRRVVWFDQPGHGESGRTPVGLPDFTAALHALATTHGPFEAAIGHSLGAAAIALALRDGLSLRRVVLICPPTSIREHTHAFARHLGIPARLRDAMRARLEHRYGVPFEHIDRLDELTRVHIPSLLVHDQDDAHVPIGHAQRLVAHLRHARLITTHGLGHFRILRDAAVIRAVCDFLDGDDAGLPHELPELPLPAPLY